MAQALMDAGRRSPRAAGARRDAATVSGLVAAAVAGQPRAWDALVDEFGGLVWAVARGHRLSDADAADVAGATWLALVEHLADLRDARRVGAWLATTARHESLRVLRNARREVPTDDDVADETAGPVDVGEDLATAERDAALWDAFGRLPARDQALLRLLVADPQPSYEEISAALRMPIGSIGPTRARSLERLRRELERTGAMTAMER